MDGLVSLLDQRHHDRVEVLSGLLQDRCGLQDRRATPFPHFSWQVAESFDFPELPERMAEWAHEQAPFSVRTNGLGLFSAPEPVLYLPVIRTAHLNRLHAQLWEIFSHLRRGENTYYAPEAWIPHVTLSMGGITQEQVACAIRLLARQSYEWTISINNLAVLFQPPGQPARIGYRHEFKQTDQDEGD